MNFWTGLILGIIVGWLVEWLIDWLFWRREASEEGELNGAARATVEAEWHGRLAAAEQDYQARLAAVEEEWQGRLNLNEQQWQAQFAALDDDRAALREQLAAAGSGPEGAVVAAAEGGWDAAPAQPAEEFALVGDREMAIALDEFAAGTATGGEASGGAGGMTVAEAPAGESELMSLEGMDADMVERLHLAGVRTTADLAAAEPTALAVTVGVEPTLVEAWARRARADGGEITQQLDVFDTRELTPILPATMGAALVAEAARQAEPVVTHHDDLTRIRGIGPKYARLLNENGIHDFAGLAAADAGRLQAIVNPGPMQQINFESWKAQAVALAGAPVAAGNDLTVLEGIGPVYAGKLRERGIATFADLAATDEATLADIISAPAWRRINYGEWIDQARLAAAGDQAGLSDLQSRLFRREGDNLNLIRGLGERSSAALRGAGIATFADLAAAAPDRVEAIVRGAGARGGDYAAWIEEAQLRATGKRVPSRSRRTVAAYVVSCPQDLSAVPGIGSVLEQRLYAAGIGSYWELAELAAEELERILDAPAFGVDVPAIRAAAMKLAVESNSQGRAWDGTPPDDFEALGGIGEIYERRLYEAGICTYAALAATPAERLAEICRAPAMRTPDYAGWIARAAELAAGMGTTAP